MTTYIMKSFSIRFWFLLTVLREKIPWQVNIQHLLSSSHFFLDKKFLMISFISQLSHGCNSSGWWTDVTWKEEFFMFPTSLSCFTSSSHKYSLNDWADIYFITCVTITYYLSSPDVVKRTSV